MGYLNKVVFFVLMLKYRYILIGSFFFANFMEGVGGHISNR